MSDDAYGQLLTATIQHLESLKARGLRHVAVQPQTLAALAAPIPAAARAASPSIRPAPVPAPAPRPTQAPISAPVVAAAPPPAPVARPVSSLVAAPPPPLAAVLTTPPVSPTPALPKAEAFAALRARALTCIRCPHLASSRHQVVFGFGDINARLMFVGEAPGADEDVQGEPFVGRAGELLTKMIIGMGLTRATVYIGNVLKCRPDTPGQPSGNRKPTTAEMQTCLPYLQEQIDLIQPQVLVALGSTAMEGLVGHPVTISKIRGQWQSYRGIPLMPTFHPAYVLRNQAMAIKRQVWEDLLAAMEHLALPISEKQRNYFLKP